jgi:putative transposase
MERLYRTLKKEEVWANKYHKPEEARASISTCITLYNEQHPHSALGYRAPLEVYMEEHSAKAT